MSFFSFHFLGYMLENKGTECPRTFCAGISPLLLGVVFSIGNRLFYFQINRDRKIDNKKIGRKKRFPQFLLCMYVCVYVCVYVCLCVCLSVRALQTSSFNIGGWNFDIDTYMWISQNGIFYFFKVLLIFRVIPLFSIFSIFFILKLLVNIS